MTFVLSCLGRDSIWLVADRRLSSKGRPSRDDAHKIMLLEATDGVAILSYTGLGATAKGTQPADWMSAVLRGRALPLENALGVVYDAFKREFPPHLVPFAHKTPISHTTLIPAILNGDPRIYSIDTYIEPGHQPDFRYTRHVAGKIGTDDYWERPIAVTGSGTAYYMNNVGRYGRHLIHIVRAYDDEKISSETVARCFAEVNSDVAKGTPDKSVGSRCFVVWRHSKDCARKGGGGHIAFDGTTKEQNTPSLPTIAANGMDVHALVSAISPFMMKAAKEGRLAEDWGKKEMDALVAHIPETPDEKLR